MSRKRAHRFAFRPLADRLEERALLSFADGNGAVVTSLVESSDGSQVIVGFDGSLNASTAQNASNYAVTGLVAGVSPEIVSTSGASDPVVSAVYSSANDQVTLTLAKPLKAGVFSRIFINGTPGSGLVDTKGNTFDGDNDDTAGGNFYAQLATGSKLSFTDSAGSRANVRITGAGQISLWRELNGDVDQMNLLGTIAGRSTLRGSASLSRASGGVVVLPSIVGLANVNYALPKLFVSTPPTPASSPTPQIATTQNLPYSLQITPVTLGSVPTIQSAVYAQANGMWLVFGGRTNGLHGFDNQTMDPSGEMNFPPEFQNNNIYVINPKTGQTWTEAWSATGVSAATYASLASTNEEYFQHGDRLYAAGGYSYDPVTSTFVTYDTLSALSVQGLMNAVIAGGSFAGQVEQIHNSAFQVTGGDMNMLGGRTFIDFGQDFEGGYNGNNADFGQIYTDEVRSFQIVDDGANLSIKHYQVQRDPINFRRRDGNLATSTIQPNGQQAITAYGGVFTVPGGTGYREPIVIGKNGFAKVQTQYQQYFSQYTSAKVGLYDARNRSMSTVFFGGISLYDFNFNNGTLTADTELPFVNDVTSLVQRNNGSTLEYMMPTQLPVNYGNYTTNYYGAESAFFTSPGLASLSNGVLKLAAIKGPTTIGFIYGGIVANQGDFGSSTASSMVFQVTLVPK